MTLTQQELHEILDYNPTTGKFVWKINIGKKIKKNDVAGYLDVSTGYIRIGIKSKTYRASRLAILYVYGALPSVVDHINLVKDDNRICNLRPADRSQNALNRNKPKSNKSGFKGVSWHKKGQKWKAAYKKKYIGLYACPIEAAKAYDVVASAENPQFARLNFPEN